MNKIVTQSVGNASRITLLGGRLQLNDGYLTLGQQDLLYDNTNYYYLSASSSREDFLSNLRRHYVKRGAVHVFDDATISYELRYVPVLKCDDKLLILNNEDDDFITDNFFCTPLQWDDSWNSQVYNVVDGCLRNVDGRLLPINLSFKEISYLAPRLELSLSDQFIVLLMPFHVAHIISEKRDYQVAQIAVRNSNLVYDFPLYDDTTFSGLVHVFFLVAIYGLGTAFVVNHSAEVKPFIENYLQWWFEYHSVPDIKGYLNDIIPIIGWLAGFLLEIILWILFVILVIGIIPAIALAVPALAAGICRQILHCR